MTDLTLSKAETKLLLEAVERGGAFDFPDTTKPSTRERVLGRLLRDELITTAEDGHSLTSAGYRVVGLRPPRAKRPAISPAGDIPAATAKAGPAPRSPKGDLVLELLGRGEGASLSELTDATGWLPHTARAALSRLRSSGKPLAKSKREDGATVYRLAPAEPASRTRKPRAEAPAQAAA